MLITKVAVNNNNTNFGNKLTQTTQQGYQQKLDSRLNLSLRLAK
jgi:hypothetical protein